MNPQEVLTPTQRGRLAAARASDKTVMIRTAEDVAARTAVGPDEDLALPHGPHARRGLRRLARLCLGRRAHQPAGRQDGAGPVGLSGRRAPATAAWGRSTEYLKFAIEDFSRRWFPYPWPNAINVGRAGRRHGISRRSSSTAPPTRARTCSGSPSTRSDTPTSR